MKKNMLFFSICLLVSSCSNNKDVEDGWNREIGLYKPLELSDSSFEFGQNGGTMWCEELTRRNYVAVAAISQFDENGNLVKYVPQDMKQPSDTSVLSCDELTVCYYQKDYKFKIEVSPCDSSSYKRWSVAISYPCISFDLLQVVQK